MQIHILYQTKIQSNSLFCKSNVSFCKANSLQLQTVKVKTYFFFILTCSFFEIWIFHGCIEDPASELFIEHHNHYRPNTKYFWDKAYLVRRESVPGFLSGFEDTTLLCGKYTMLLKAFRPDHPLLSLRPPALEVCLSAEQIARLQQTCTAYERCAVATCGVPISVADVFRQKAAHRQAFMQLVATKFQENLEKWRREQIALRSAKRETHEQDRAALQQQIAEVRERKIESRRERLALEREHLRLEQQCEDERLLKEAAQRQKNIDYYTELGELVDAQRAEAEAIVAACRRQQQHPTAVDSQTSLSSQYETAREGEDNEELDENLAENEEEDADDDDVYHSTENLDEFITTTGDDTVPPIELKKSASDFFNSNEIQMTAATANRTKMLGSGFDFNNYASSSTTSTTTTSTTTTTMDANSNVMVAAAALSAREECKRNKNKVLGQEFDIICPTITVVMPSDGQQLEETELSAYQRNRRRAMNDGTMTDLQRNRQRALHDEFGGSYPTPAKNLQLNLAPLLITSADVLTPMSTGSDSPVQSEHLDDVLLNAVNNNNNNNSRRPSLKLDTTSIPARCAIPSTAQLARPTPASGLCATAAAVTNEGFDFDISSTSARSRQPLISLPDKSTETDGTSSLVEIRDLNITTITHYLQRSFVLPMQAHLSVLNNEILRIYLCDLDILGHFKSLRNYFFMMDGEFASHICDGIIGKLEAANARPQELLNFNVLHSLLNNALGSSIIGNDKNAEKLSFYLDDVPDEFDLKSPNALSALSLSYAVEWPLNLLLNSETIAHYANIFRHLLKLRRIRWVLDKTFEMLKETGRLSARKRLRSPQYDHVQQIRNKLLGFVNALQNHITSNALQVSWRRFKNELTAATSMEDLYQKHTAYMKRVEFLCMLNKSSHEFLAKLQDVFIVVLRFYR